MLSTGREIPVAHVLNILERNFERPWIKQDCSYQLPAFFPNVFGLASGTIKNLMKLEMTGMLTIHHWNCKHRVFLIQLYPHFFLSICFADHT